MENYNTTCNPWMNFTASAGQLGTVHIHGINQASNACTNSPYLVQIASAMNQIELDAISPSALTNCINDLKNSITRTCAALGKSGHYEFGSAPEFVSGIASDAAITTPTPATSDNSTNVATTAYVQAQGYAPLASPAFTGTPTAPTATAGDNSTKLATTAYVQGQTTGIPCLTVPRGGSVSGVTFSTTANQAAWWGVVLTFPLTTTQVTYYVGTADNTSNTYDIGVYDNAGNLKAPIGSTAGTTFASTTGGKTLSWTSAVTLQPGRYYLAVTTSCTSSCAALDGDNASAVTFLSRGIVLVAGGGTLSGPITPPADAWSWSASTPAWAVR
jgi:hypothetical protein